MKRELVWHSLERDNLPELLLGDGQLDSYSRTNLSEFDLDKLRVSAGFDSRGKHNNNPALIVFSDNNSADIFSWLRVYAPETSPLSQLTRIVNFEDWKLCRNVEHARRHQELTYQWACLTLGEVIAQSETETEISNIPLSRSQASYTNTVAKATTLHANNDITRTTITRLKALEQEYRFVNRSVAIDDLQPMWELLQNFTPSIHPPADIVKSLIDQIESQFNSTRSLVGSRLSNHPGLFSDSIEERVVTFHKIANEILESPSTKSLKIVNCATLSAAAFLVGRGTSHLFLLRKWSKELPASLAWFGLIAAYVGPRCWDPQWARAVKSIDRSFQSDFDWFDVTQSDLCWAEYSWLSKTYDGHEIFSDIPKMYPRVLSIEVFPGASCQFRLLSSTTSMEMDRKRQAVNSQREKEIQSTLSELVNLAVKAKNLMAADQREPSSRQESFQLESSNASKDSRPKRGGRSPSGKQ